MSSGSILPRDVDELAVVQRHYQSSRQEADSATLTLCPTLACNFACDYCFQGAHKPSEKMSGEVQDAVLALLERIRTTHRNLRLLHVAWYGGEPLQRVSVIKDLSDKLLAACLEHGINYTASMVTNGFFLTREVAQALVQRGLSLVQITIDGPEDVHDARRHLKSRRGSYAKIISNLQSWIREVPLGVQIRVNIDERNKADLFRLIDDLAAAGLGHLPNFKLYFAPVESMTPGCHSVSEVTMRKLDYGLLETQLYQRALRAGLADLPTPAVFLGICSAVRPYDYIVTPTGDVHKCWETVSFAKDAVGSVFDLDGLFAMSSPNMAAWHRFDPFTHDTCTNCKILPNCAGSCAHKFVDEDAAIGESILPCPSLKYSVREKIILKCLVEGHITEDAYDPEAIRTNPKDICSEVFVPKGSAARVRRLPVVGGAAEL